MKELLHIVWDERAAAHLEKICAYVRESSFQNAEKMKQDILDKTEQIPLHPEKYPADKYRKKNKGDFRAFELHHVRVSYQITDEHIFIVRVRSTYQEPKQF